MEENGEMERNSTNTRDPSFVTYSRDQSFAAGGGSFTSIDGLGQKSFTGFPLKLKVIKD